jgi:hypothetical protein
VDPDLSGLSFESFGLELFQQFLQAWPQGLHEFVLSAQDFSQPRPDGGEVLGNDRYWAPGMATGRLPMPCWDQLRLGRVGPCGGKSRYRFDHCRGQELGETAVAPIIHMKQVRREERLERNRVLVMPSPHQHKARK